MEFVYRDKSELKDSGVHWIGEIPHNWRCSKVKRYLTSQKQGYYTTEEYIQEGVRLIRITDIK